MAFGMGTKSENVGPFHREKYLVKMRDVILPNFSEKEPAQGNLSPWRHISRNTLLPIFIVHGDLGGVSQSVLLTFVVAIHSREGSGSFVIVRLFVVASLRCTI